MSKILFQLPLHPPRHGPEWGSGGIFGLKYHRGVLYYTLSFEAKSYFISEDEVIEYDFNYIGPAPRSGGDTYNAVDVVDEFIYFGGWVHAPAVYKRKSKYGSTISFVNKYSHVHEYDVANNNVRLLWKESIHHETKWAGEVSEIIYDPINDRLLVARADGHVNLGVYEVNRSNGKIKQLASYPALKGSMYLDYACFGINVHPKGIQGIECIDLVNDKVIVKELRNISSISVDGDGVYSPRVGVAISAYGKLFTFVKGGVIVGNPVDESMESLRFIRLFDFVKAEYGPLRTTAKPIGGGILIAFNSQPRAILHPLKEEEELQRALNTVIGPSILLYVTPPIARIIGIFGARITSIERIGDKLLLATNTMANLEHHDATPIDVGFRDFTILSMDILYKSPPLSFKVTGKIVEDKTFGGIPLTGYKEPYIRIHTTKSNKLTIKYYDLSLPPNEAQEDEYELKEGANIIDLKSYRDYIVSFKLDRPDHDSTIKINLY